jgi:hypothetical protein
MILNTLVVVGHTGTLPCKRVHFEGGATDAYKQFQTALRSCQGIYLHLILHAWMAGANKYVLWLNLFILVCDRYYLQIELEKACANWERFINKKTGEKNKNTGEFSRQKNGENQVTLNSIFGPSKEHYLSYFVLYALKPNNLQFMFSLPYLVRQNPTSGKTRRLNVCESSSCRVEYAWTSFCSITIKFTRHFLTMTFAVFVTWPFFPNPDASTQTQSP